MKPEPKLLSPEELSGIRRRVDQRSATCNWAVADDLLGHISAMCEDMRLYMDRLDVATGLNISDRQRFEATNDRLKADLREATDTLATARRQLAQYRRDFQSMSDRAADLARQLTATERRHDTTMIRLRALTAAAADLLTCREIDVAADEAAKLADAVEAAIDGVPS